MTSTSTEPTWVLQAKGLCVGYRGRAILPPIDLAVGREQLWALIGHNGSGKSTLLRTLLGLQRKVAGEVRWAEGLRVGYVPQRSDLDMSVPARVIDLVHAGVDHGWSFVQPLLARRRHAAVARAVADVGVESLTRAQFAELSEGQKQRVLVARALVTDPHVLVLDEPTSAMDLAAETAVFTLLEELLVRRRLAIIVVSHQLSALTSRASHMAMLDKDAALAVAGSLAEVSRHPAFVERYGFLLQGSPPDAESRRAAERDRAGRET